MQPYSVQLKTKQAEAVYILSQDFLRMQNDKTNTNTIVLLKKSMKNLLESYDSSC